MRPKQIQANLLFFLIVSLWFAFWLAVALVGGCFLGSFFFLLGILMYSWVLF